MSTPTKAELKAMADVAERSKGWPVGIPVRERMARQLVAKGFCEWAPPMYAYPKVFTVRLTTAGKVAIAMAHPDYPANMWPATRSPAG